MSRAQIANAHKLILRYSVDGKKQIHDLPFPKFDVAAYTSGEVYNTPYPELKIVRAKVPGLKQHGAAPKEHLVTILLSIRFQRRNFDPSAHVKKLDELALLHTLDTIPYLFSALPNGFHPTINSSTIPDVFFLAMNGACLLCSR